MRALVTVGVVGLAACGASAPHQPPPAPPVPLSHEIRGCGDAAVGLERATIGLRDPELSLLAVVRQRCTEDSWPAVAIECFAGMAPDDLGPCAAKLARHAREALFAVIGGTEQDAGSVALIVARLGALEVGILACDRFVAAVSTLMSCERMPLDARVQLGTETASFWSLPTSGLPIAAQARMAAACGESLRALQQQAVGVGCMP